MRALGLILVLVLVLVGCGGESAPVSAKERYERQFTKTVEKWQERGEREVPDIPDDASLPEQSVSLEVGLEMMLG